MYPQALLLRKAQPKRMNVRNTKWMWVSTHSWNCWDQKRVPDPMDLKLQMAMRSLIYMLGKNIRPLEEQYIILPALLFPASPLCLIIFYSSLWEFHTLYFYFIYIPPHSLPDPSRDLPSSLYTPNFKFSTLVF